MSEPFVRPARSGDSDDICRLLHGKMSDKISVERWRRILNYTWAEDKPDLGRVVEDNGRIVGFVSMVYSERRIAGQREHIVNINSWYLERRYRGCGLGVELMRSATADPLRSYHILTSSAKTTGILAELGYRVMDAESFVWRRTRQPERSLPVVEDPVEIKRRVSAEHARLLDDHKGLPVTPRLLADAGEYGLLLFSVVKKLDHTIFYDLLYLSNAGLFLTHARDFVNQVLPAGKTAMAADCRFLHGYDVSTERMSIAVPRFYKSTRVAPWHLDNLYSEIPLLGLKL